MTRHFANLAAAAVLTMGVSSGGNALATTTDAASATPVSAGLSASVSGNLTLLDALGQGSSGLSEKAAATGAAIELLGDEPALGVHPGTLLVVLGSGFTPNEDVNVWIGDVSEETLETLKADKSGDLTGSVVIPDGAAVGPNTVHAKGLTSKLTATAPFKVVAEQGQPAGEITGITRTGCEVTITVQTTGEGQFVLDVLNGSEVVATFPWVAKGGGSHSVSWMITKTGSKNVPGKNAGGVGFFLSANARSVDYVDPWEYSDAVADACAGTIPVNVDLPGYNPAVGTQPGVIVDIAGVGFWPDEDVTVTLNENAANEAAITTFEAAEDGSFSGSAKVPLGTKAGEYVVSVEGSDSQRRGSATLKVADPVEPVAPKPVNPKSDMAETGSSGVKIALLVGGGALVLGSGFVLLRRFTR